MIEYKFPRIIPVLRDTDQDPDLDDKFEHVMWLRIVNLPLNLTWAWFLYIILTLQFHCLLYEGAFNIVGAKESYSWTDSSWMRVICIIFGTDVILTLLYKIYEENVNDSKFAPSWAYVLIDCVTIVLYTSWIFPNAKDPNDFKYGFARVDAIRCIRVVRILRLFIYQRQIVLKQNVAFIFIQFMYGLYFITMVYTIIGELTLF